MGLDWVTKQYPRAKVDWLEAKADFRSISIRCNHKDGGEITQVILDYLGGQGWEAFAISKEKTWETVWFKRPT